jgi:5-methylcytosine-specific restriction endonuclease McrA
MPDVRHTRRWREHIVPRIIRRDRGICHLCDQAGATTADHVVPRSQGGIDHPSNLKAAHIDCNRLRGDRTIAWARAEIARRNTDALPSGYWEW